MAESGRAQGGERLNIKKPIGNLGVMSNRRIQL
jgi:hypothetical protein